MGSGNAPAGAAPRALAARILAAVLCGRSLKAELAAKLPAIADARDRALVEAICFGALRARRRYEFALSRWMPRPLPAKDARIHALLLAGLAQLEAMRLPAHAAIAATAEAARVLDRPMHVGLVNALLRRATREPLPASDDPAIAHDHPDWLLAALRRDWPEDWPAIVSANRREAPLWLRVNAARIARDDYAQRLHDAGIAFRVARFPRAALMLERALPPSRLPGWDAGLVSVQDGAAQLAVEALDARPGERVLDACAAPGGKTAQLLEGAQGIDLVALDVDEARLARVRDTLTRLGLDARATLRAADAAAPAAWWDGRPFDAIVLDAPCSATGIVRRQPDILWHRRASDIAALVATQARLLDALWTMLKPGGRLLYATCSTLRDENDRQIAAFLTRTSDAEACALDARYGRSSGAGRQRLPGEDGMDGFFHALLRKSSL